MERIVLGLTEKVNIKEECLVARIDTGAEKSSICKTVVKKLGLGPVIKMIIIKSANGKTKRPVIKENIIIGEKEIEAEFSIIDRTRLKYPMLIGQDILKKGFIIDPLK